MRRGSHKASRRQVLQAAAGAIGGITLLKSPLTAFSYQANSRLRLAVVGMAGYGAWHGFTEALHTYGNVEYAVSCDVDQRKVKRVYDLWNTRAKEWTGSPDKQQREAAQAYYVPLSRQRPPLFADFRRMLDEAADQFDAVVVATPDHTHAVIAAAALRAGKPVFCEKPLTISAHEARALHRLAQETGLPTQLNNHGCAKAAFRRGVEIIREGHLGDVREVHIFFNRGGRNFKKTPQGSQPLPPELDWDRWLAQLPWREYHSEWINRIGWRETSIGELGNFGPHTGHMAFMGLNVRKLWDSTAGSSPLRVHAECSEANQISYPRWEKIHWEVPARGEQPPVKITWHNGVTPDNPPGTQKVLQSLLRQFGATDKDVTELLPYAGCLIVGSQGLIATGSHNTDFRMLPGERFSKLEQKHPQSTPLSPGHYQEWTDACRGGRLPLSNFTNAAPFAEFLTIGSLATRFPEEVIEYSPSNGTIGNHPKAAERLSYVYRDGYRL